MAVNHVGADSEVKSSYTTVASCVVWALKMAIGPGKAESSSFI